MQYFVTFQKITATKNLSQISSGNFVCQEVQHLVSNKRDQLQQLMHRKRDRLDLSKVVVKKEDVQAQKSRFTYATSGNNTFH